MDMLPSAGYATKSRFPLCQMVGLLLFERTLFTLASKGTKRITTFVTHFDAHPVGLRLLVLACRIFY